MESPFTVPIFRAFPHLTSNFNDTKSITSVLHFSHFKIPHFNDEYIAPKETLNGSSTAERDS